MGAGNTAMVESTGEVCGSLTVGGKNPKSGCRKKAVWKEVLAASDGEAKDRCMEAYKEEKGKRRI